jgi:HEAT repeat protein
MPAPSSGGPLGPSTGGPRGPLDPGMTKAPSTPSEGSVRADPADWRTWWRFNSDAYIDLKTLLNQLDRVTPGEDLGLDSKKLSQKTVETVVVPALWSALQTAGDTTMVRNAMLSLARIEACWKLPEGVGFSQLAPQMLANSHVETAEAAIVALGVAGKAGSADALIEILGDTEKGRKAIQQPGVDYRRRSFAAYALALISQRNEDAELRKRIAFALMKNLDSRATAPYDVQLASLISLGMVTLPAHGEELEAKNQEGHLCRGEQLNFLLEYLDDSRRHPSLRAQAVIPLARLAHGADDADFDAIRGALLEPFAGRSKSPVEVRQSCVIGLGLLGDADADAIDAEVRATLYRAAADDDKLTRSLALVSLAKVAGRPGKGGTDAEAFAEAQGFLLGKLVRGDASQRAWAGLSLGVLGVTRYDNGQTAAPELAQALRGTLDDAKQKDDVGAHCLGLGLLRDGDAADLLVERLVESKDDGTRACAALASGLVGAKAAFEPLQKMLESSTQASSLYVSAALGLRIAGSAEISSKMVARAQRRPVDESTDDVARLLGYLGDARTVDELAALVAESANKPEIRAAACEALGEICDLRARHWTSSLATDLHYGLLSSTLLSFGGDGTGILEMR